MLSPEERQEIEAELARYPYKQAVSIDAMKIVQRHRGWVSDEALVDIGDLELAYAALLLDAGEVDEQMQASAAQRLRQLARAIRGQHHDRTLVRAQGAELGDRDLEIGKQFEQEGLKLLVSFVDLID